MSAHYEFSHSAAAETYNRTTSTSSSSSPTRTSGTGKKNSSSKKRFSEEQIKLMESIFETESKLDHPKQLQLASHLGLQPRQVAIWFQNRRARSKSKHLQRSYYLLQANYDALASKVEALKKENHALLLQLQELKDSKDQTFCCKKVEDESMMDRKSDNGGTFVKPSPSMERSEQIPGILSDDDRSSKAEYVGAEDELAILSFSDKHTDSPLTSQEVWRNLESTDDDFLAQSDGGYQWWDFWS
ncbi:homeobox-leucine zipper protein ATHB-12-like [Neltuma alba]|uniref:homeobox-leucine zipper protein ATHB-12-like n=1 Tax=Neltuma alba TaxID=207710 RepID=UPI0010A39721|nr:homeobox-leucine zipper protein ATHB-12-like [Prosopis alba]